jgi:hypothetical protein
MPGVVYPDKALDTDKSERALALENKSTAGAAMAKKNEVAALANTARETDSRLHSYASHVADANAQGVGGPQAGNIANAYALYMQLLKQAGYKDPIPAFTDANAAQQFMAKNQDFLAAQTSDAFGQHSNAARQALAMSLPNIDMQPEVRSAMMAQLLVDQQRVKELDSAYKYSSTKAGGPQRSFENVPTNYDNANKGRLNAAKQQLTSLMMHPSDFMKRAFNGEFTEAEIERRLAGNGDPRKAMPGYDPSMHISSFFPHKAPPRQ